MKLSKSSSIRVHIRKQGSKSAHITLEDTTIAQAAEYIKAVLKPHADPFAEGRVTSVTISTPAVNVEDEKKSLTFSFRGLEPAETRLLICESIVTDPKERNKECVQTTT